MVADKGMRGCHFGYSVCYSDGAFTVCRLRHHFSHCHSIAPKFPRNQTVNLPICAVGFATIPIVLTLHNPRTPLREGLYAIDWIGSVAVVGGTVLFLLGLELGGVTYPWASPTVLGLVLSGILLLSLACFHFARPDLTRTPYPLVPIALFADRHNCAAYAVAFIHGFVLISASYFLPLYFQAVLGATPLQSGLYLLPYALSLSTTSAMAGWAIQKTGSYLWLIISVMALTVLGFGLLVDLGPAPAPASAPTTTSSLTAKAVIYQLLAGAGIGPNSQATLIAIQTAISAEDIGAATSTFVFARQLATAISIVVGGAVFSGEMQRQSASLAAELSPEVAEMLAAHYATANAERIARVAGREGWVARQAYDLGLRNMRVVYAAFAGAGLVLSVFIRHRRLADE